MATEQECKTVMIARDLIQQKIVEQFGKLPDMLCRSTFKELLKHIDEEVESEFASKENSSGENLDLLLSSVNSSPDLTPISGQPSAVKACSNSDVSITQSCETECVEAALDSSSNNLERSNEFRTSTEKTYPEGIEEPNYNGESDLDSDMEDSEGDLEPMQEDYGDVLLHKGKDRGEMLWNFTRKSEVRVDDCEGVAAYFDLLMSAAPYRDHPTPVQIVFSKVADDTVDWWWESVFCPDWNGSTGRDFEPLWDLLKADAPPTFEAILEVECVILDLDL